MTEEIEEKHNVLWVDSLSMIPGTGGELGKFDIVVCSYVI